MTSDLLSRRRILSLLAVGSVSTLASCASSGPQRFTPIAATSPAFAPSLPPGRTPELDATYGQMVDGGFVIPAVPYWKIPPRFYRQRVPNTTGEPAGTVIVDTQSRFLYLVEPGGETAMRYGVGIGREGFAWSGEGVIQWRQKWPRWTPPMEMVARQPELAKYAPGTGGMEPGTTNPLGARALYIFQNGKDTLYRLHGNPEWNSIGKAVSSGCVRLLNQDIIDLYERVPTKARIIVWQ
ncbi:L,D-transpeptidase [Rhizobium helianthi]|uniref:L,D-transpeptidase n=1 Tax=Rhizobium helianthi TaxID=1132695 RepID=A0ABW4M2I9_9HYPH